MLPGPQDTYRPRRDGWQYAASLRSAGEYTVPASAVPYPSIVRQPLHRQSRSAKGKDNPHYPYSGYPPSPGDSPGSSLFPGADTQSPGYSPPRSPLQALALAARRRADWGAVDPYSTAYLA